MQNSRTPKTLLMIIKKQWLVDSITSLGSGYLTHLAYPNENIDPGVLGDLKMNQGMAKVLGEIVFQGRNSVQNQNADQCRNLGQCVAEVEIIEVNDFDTFIRFDFRLLEVSPFVRRKCKLPDSRYLCFYLPKTA